MATYEVYEEGDSILPLLNLCDPCNVRVEITDEDVRLFVGPRDWAWDRKTGLLRGAGTALGNPVPESD